jgi:3-hydroxyacyl-[acyl-carrier-protein] dehydratase
MRFLFYDRVLELEPDKRVLATKAVSIGDEFLGEHYGRRPIMPATLMIESLAQVAGWLYIVSEAYAVRTVLAMVQGVRVERHPRPGDTLTVEAWMEYRHRDGASFRGEVRVDEQPAMTVRRLVFASERTGDPLEIARARELFAYLSGGFPAPRARL